MEQTDLTDRLFAAVVWATTDATPTESGLPHVTHTGALAIGGAVLRCYQLSDGTRVLDAQDCAALFGWEGRDDDTTG